MDAKSRRMKLPVIWGIFGALFNVFAIALLHGNRWLKEGETRSGGRGWDTCRWLAISATIFFFLFGLSARSNVSSQVPSLADSAALSSYAMGSALDAEGIFYLWLFTAIGILLVGLILKKDAKEIGPTGPLATEL